MEIKDQGDPADTPNEPPYRLTRRIAMMGARGVGKSAVTIRVAEDRFEEVYHPTLEDIYTMIMEIDDVTYNVRVVDTDGKEFDSELGVQSLLGVDGFVLMFSLRDESSLRIAMNINQKLVEALAITSKSSRHEVPRLLVGNKQDLEDQRKVSYETAKATAAKMRLPYMECSACTNVNTREIFETVVRLLNSTSSSDSDSDPQIDEGFEQGNRREEPDPRSAPVPERKERERSFPCTIQ